MNGGENERVGSLRRPYTGTRKGAAVVMMKLHTLLGKYGKSRITLPSHRLAGLGTCCMVNKGFFCNGVVLCIV